LWLSGVRLLGLDFNGGVIGGLLFDIEGAGQPLALVVTVSSGQ